MGEANPGGRWVAEVVERAAGVAVTMVVGESDTGKTTLVACVASALHERGERVGIVDADVGQSEIGPPTTIGLGAVRRALGRLSEAEPVAVHFVGTTSPVANMLGTVVGTALLTGAARRSPFDRVLIDTGGLVRGELGRGLKHAKIDLARPDLVVVLQREGECEPLLRRYAAIGAPVILRLPSLNPGRRRTADDRRRHRAAALARYFSAAQSITLDLRRVAVDHPPLFMGKPIAAGERERAAEAAGSAVVWAERREDGALVVTAEPLGDAEARALDRALGGHVTRHALRDVVGVLAGLCGASGETLGVGVVRALDFDKRTMTLEAPAVIRDDVAAVVFGRERYAR